MRTRNALPSLTLALVALTLPALTACEDNTTCTIGTLLCTNADGEVAQDGDQQLRECSNDESKGGDEDGEFVVVEDCAADGNACVTELLVLENREIGGCISRACADDGIVDCLELGRGICGFDDDLLVCGLDAESGCQRYTVDEGCTANGGVCVDREGGAICEADAA